MILAYLIKFDSLVESTGTNGIEKTQRPDSVHVSRVLTQLK